MHPKKFVTIGNTISHGYSWGDSLIECTGICRLASTQLVRVPLTFMGEFLNDSTDNDSADKDIADNDIADNVIISTRE